MDSRKTKAAKVAVAMSGGVDSSVAAVLLMQKFGAENVIGMTMKLFCYGEAETGERACCSLSSIEDARKVCHRLGIPHYIVDLEKEFEKEVICEFINEYEKGMTPNPCVRCNDLIKFKHLYHKAKQIGCEYLATGHYARIESVVKNQESGAYKLLKGKDVSKDQSYFLAGLSQEQLAHTLFPLGELTKTEVRDLARENELTTAEKAESQDICFVTTTIEDFLKGRTRVERGKIVDKLGKRLGEHEGIVFYTIGQRKGLGGGFEDKMYVTGINAERNEVEIGKFKDLFRKNLLASDLNWIEKPEFPAKLSAKIRYQAKEALCLVAAEGSKIRVDFDEPQKAITPGQLIVFYNGDEVVGSGKIRLD
jgi:tRNA-specific 2-thiouridylase